MEKLAKGVYTQEFRAEAVKLVLERGLTITLAARQLIVPVKTLTRWVQIARQGKLALIGATQKARCAEEVELTQLKQERARVKMERDFLKKGAAYFAKGPA